MSSRSCCAGPVRATDCPSTTCESVTPCAQARPAARASPSVERTLLSMTPSPLRSGCEGNDTSAGEELPHLVHEALGAGAVPVGILLHGLVQLAQELALPVGEAHRRLDDDLAHEVAGVGRAHALDALGAQAKDLARLRLHGDLDLGAAVERGNLDLAAQGRLREADRHLAVEVVALAPEDAVGLQVDHHVEVAGRAAVHASLALAGQADAIGFVHAGGNLHRERLVLLQPSRAPARGAWIAHGLAGAVARGTRLLDGEEALRQAHRARAMAGLARLGLRPRFRARALAGLARLHGGDADLGLGAARGLLERDLEVVAQVRAPEDRRASAPLCAEDVAEDVAERLGESAESFRPAAHPATADAHLRIHAGMAVC